MSQPQPEPERGAANQGPESQQQRAVSAIKLTLELRKLVSREIGDMPSSLRDEFGQAIEAEVQQLLADLDQGLQSAASRLVSFSQEKISETIARRLTEGSFDAFLRELSTRTQLLDAVYEATRIILSRKDDFYTALYLSDQWLEKLTDGQTGSTASESFLLSFWGYKGRQERPAIDLERLGEALREPIYYLVPYFRSRNSSSFLSAEIFEGQPREEKAGFYLESERLYIFPSHYGSQNLGALFVSIPDHERLQAAHLQSLRLIAHDFGAGLAHLKRLKDAEGGSLE